MGCRHVIVAVKSNEVRLAQFGSFDGYPDEAGIFLLDFLRNDKKRSALYFALDNIEFASENNDGGYADFLNQHGLNSPLGIPIESMKMVNEHFPWFDRTLGYEVVQRLIDTPEKKILLWNRMEFITQGLFCEWVYVIDYDLKVFETFKGGNTTPLEPYNRFYSLGNWILPLDDKMFTEKVFYPPKLLRAFAFEDLPDNDTYLTIINLLSNTTNDPA